MQGGGQWNAVGTCCSALVSLLSSFIGDLLVPFYVLFCFVLLKLIAVSCILAAEQILNFLTGIFLVLIFVFKKYIKTACY